MCLGQIRPLRCGQDLHQEPLHWLQQRGSTPRYSAQHHDPGLRDARTYDLESLKSTLSAGSTEQCRYSHPRRMSLSHYAVPPVRACLISQAHRRPTGVPVSIPSLLLARCKWHPIQRAALFPGICSPWTEQENSQARGYYLCSSLSSASRRPCCVRIRQTCHSPLSRVSACQVRSQATSRRKPRTERHEAQCGMHDDDDGGTTTTWGRFVVFSQKGRVAGWY